MRPIIDSVPLSTVTVLNTEYNAVPRVRPATNVRFQEGTSGDFLNLPASLVKHVGNSAIHDDQCCGIETGRNRVRT